MVSQLKPALVMLVLMTLITGVLYPIVVTAAAQVVFPNQANGSLIVKDGHVVGSSLIGQAFDEPKYFWGRLSATSVFPYNAAASSGSNFGPTNSALATAAQSRIDALRAADPQNTAPIPVDLVTASASGLDPDISVAAARYQVPRVARARGLSDAQVQTLLARFTTERQFGILGEPRVNVLQLNLALDVVK